MEQAQSANIDLVRRMYEALSQGDIDAMVELVGADMEFFPQVTASMVDRREPYRGHDGLRRYVEDAARVWVQLDIIPHEFRDLGDRVLVFGRVYGRGEGGYISDSPAAWLWRIREGHITWGRAYTNRVEALEAAGIDDA